MTQKTSLVINLVSQVDIWYARPKKTQLLAKLADAGIQFKRTKKVPKFTLTM
jgi:hypothetical protein